MGKGRGKNRRGHNSPGWIVLRAPGEENLLGLGPQRDKGVRGQNRRRNRQRERPEADGSANLERAVGGHDAQGVMKQLDGFMLRCVQITPP